MACYSASTRPVQERLDASDNRRSRAQNDTQLVRSMSPDVDTINNLSSWI
jgi:hypothetical protein